MPSDAARAVVASYAGHIARPAGEVIQDLEMYVQLLVRWQSVQNLVSRETMPVLWTRHIADSLQVLVHLRPGDEHFLDLGSGGGLPALPLAIARKGVGDPRFVLIEANGRKVSFLRTVARELALPIEVVEGRIEAYDSHETAAPDVITSRALADLPVLCRLASPHFGRDTRAIFHKGRDFGEELERARSEWTLDVVAWPSDTSSDSALLEIRDLRAKTAP
jgi:16S rRNA (guanine527-N7)-methyltransferase